MQNRALEIASHLSGLRKYAAVLVRDPVEADDLVQECLCRAIERIRPWHTIKDLRAYLFAILHNVYVDKVARRRDRNDIVSNEIVERKLVAMPTQFHHMEVVDLSRALAWLTPEHRQVILLIGLDGMSYKSAAKLLGIPVGTVMSRLYRAREALRALLDGGLEADGDDRKRDAAEHPGFAEHAELAVRRAG